MEKLTDRFFLRSEKTNSRNTLRGIQPRTEDALARVRSFFVRCDATDQPSEFSHLIICQLALNLVRIAKMVQNEIGIGG